MKKLFALLLAVVMVFSLGVTAFATAAAPAAGKITIANAPENTEYAAYKIFDAEVNADEDVIYSLNANSPWFDVLVNADGTSKVDGLSFLKEETVTNKYIVIAEAGFSAADFAAYLRNNKPTDLQPVISEEDPATAGLAEGQRTRVILNLEPGYYLVLPIEPTDKTTKIEKDGGAFNYIGTEKGVTATTWATLDSWKKALYDTDTKYYKKGDDIVNEAYYNNSLTETEKANWALFYKRADYIPESTFQTLVANDDTTEIGNYNPVAASFARIADKESFVSEKAYGAMTTPIKDLYEENTGVKVYYHNSDTVPGEFPVTEADYKDMDTTEQAKYREGKIYKTKDTIPAAKFMALNDGTNTALMAKYEAVGANYGAQNVLNPGETVVLKPADVATPVLTTVLEGQNVQVQNKNDMPLDKTVDNTTTGEDDVNNQGVNVGDELHYTIKTRVPITQDGEYISTFALWDKMSEGLTLKDNTITITIKANGENPEIKYVLVYNKGDGKTAQTLSTLTETKSVGGVEITSAAVAQANNTTYKDFKLVLDRTRDLTGYEVRFEPESAKGYTFELSLPVASELLKKYELSDILIEYDAVVNDSAVAELLKNVASLTYTDENGNDWTKDIETDNYISRIVIDKFETGNRTQKLTGAEFVLYKVYTQAEYDALVKEAKDKAYEKSLNDAKKAASDAAIAAYKALYDATFFGHDSANYYDADFTFAAPTAPATPTLNPAPKAYSDVYNNAKKASLDQAYDAAVAARKAIVGRELNATEIDAIQLAIYGNATTAANATVLAAAKEAGKKAVLQKVATDAASVGTNAATAAEAKQENIDNAVTAAEAAEAAKKAAIAVGENYYQLTYEKTPASTDPNTGYVTPAVRDAIKIARFTDDSGLVYDKPLVVDANGKLVLDAEGNVQFYKGVQIKWVTTEADATKVVTDANGFAQFAYLEDGTYYLKEIKAPINYAKLLGPKEIVVDGSDAVDQRLDAAQREQALTNLAYVENTPGSSLPSTGGVGATMMTIGGIALIVAAGAFLVLRRRKEQE